VVLEIYPERCGSISTLGKSEIFAARDQKLIGMLTGAAPHCGPRPGKTSPTLGWSAITVKPVKSRGGGWQSHAAAENLTKNVKMSLFDIISEVQKDLEDVSAGKGQFKKIMNKNFVQNLMSKFVRSTLTSPGRIRVKRTDVRGFCLFYMAYLG
jgi:hypothetical protein